MKFGISLPADLFGENPKEATKKLCESFGGKEAFLAFCAENVDAVEIRAVGASTDPVFVRDAAALLHEYGLTATIHGTLNGCADADAFFAPYRLILEERAQKVYNVTVHPLGKREETAALLRLITEKAKEESYPVFIALENQRLKDYGTKNGLCADVEAIVNEIGSPYLGVCFDFGHSLSNERKFSVDAPTDSFYAAVRHTHIHSMEKRTHFPLSVGETLLDRNLSALFACEYDGILSLELSPDRFMDRFPVKEAIEESVAILKRAALLAEQKKEITAFYREGYGVSIKEMRESFDACESAVGLVCPAGYVIKMGDVRIAVDVAISDLPIPAEDKKQIADWLGEFDLCIVTHAHGDHYDKPLLASLPEKVKRICPDFMAKDVSACTAVTDGTVYPYGELTISFFSAAHVAVPELGFAICYRGEHYVFPADVRDYTAPHPVFPNTRLLFAHLWLGRKNALRLAGDTLNEFCRFLQSFGAETVCLAHLLDTRRTLDDMWNEAHVDLVRRSVRDVHPFITGDLVSLEDI